MSAKYHIDQEELKKVAHNALVFSAPALILILTNLQAGRSWEEISNIVYLWGLNTALDLLRKFTANSPKKK